MAKKTTRREAQSKAATKFPLTYHAATGQYKKKIHGKVHYFGNDKDRALARWQAEKDGLLSGRDTQKIDPKALTLRELANSFLTAKRGKLDGGELTLRQFNELHSTCERMLKALGKDTAVKDVDASALLKHRASLGRRLGPTALGNEIQRCRSVFNWGFKNSLIDVPVRFGDFVKPDKSVIRKSRNSKGERLFEAAELRQIIDAADVQLRAMILLGVNCGLGNADCGSLPIKAVDLDNAWLTFPRVKTGIKRRSKLWPETVLAIREYLKVRREPNDQENAGLLFVTTYGNPWHVDGSKGRPITAEFRKLLGKLNLYREGLSFYSLRHCVQTLGDELTGDFLAVTHVMGHADSSISDHYRERMHDGRLVAVSDAIRGWLFGSEVVKS